MNRSSTLQAKYRRKISQALAVAFRGIMILPFLLLSNLQPDASAQVGNCDPAIADVMFEVGNVRARIPNNGGLFWRGSPHIYEVPKNGDSNALFVASIWIGGLMNNELRVAASTYGPWEFWPGPLDENGTPPNSCEHYDNVWQIGREDIVAYLDSNIVTENMANWPWQFGAPVVDGDGNPTNYNLEGGDLPELLGDRRLWWVMNDQGNTHDRTHSEHIGLEVHASVFGFYKRGTQGDQTFYSYRLINKNSEPLKETYFGLYTDPDLGNFDDDFVGSDSLLNLGYAYNSDNDDEGGEGYGIAPPAIGFTFLETIDKSNDGFDNDRDGDIDEAGEKLGATGFVNFTSGGGIRGDPGPASDFYNAMKARWKDGSPILEGLNGSNAHRWSNDLPLKPTRFMYPGDPVTSAFWTERNLDGEGTPNYASDRRMVTSMGPFELIPNDTVDVRFAIVWARGDDNLDSVTKLKNITAGIQSSAKGLFAPTRILPSNTPPPSFVLGFDQNFPNPFVESTTLRYSLPQSMRVRLAVYDILGRELDLLVDAQQDAGVYTIEFDAADLPAGLYLARIKLDHLRFTKRMVKTG